MERKGPGEFGAVAALSGVGGKAAAPRIVFRFLVTPTVMLALGLLASRFNFLLFHTLVELFIAVVALTALAVASTARRFTHNYFIVFVAIGLGWCAILDALHMAALTDARLFQAGAGDLGMQFWEAARLMQAAALLCAPLFLRRQLVVPLQHLVFGALTAVMVLWIMSGHFPVTDNPASHLDRLRDGTSGVVIVMLVLSAGWLQRSRRLMTPKLFFSMQAIVALLFGTELFYSFVERASEHSWVNEMAHVCKAYAYWLVYLAVVQDTLREPFGMLARTASTYDAIPTPACLVEAGGKILQANRAAGYYATSAPEHLVGRQVHDVFHDPATRAADCPVCRAMQEHMSEFVTETRDAAGRSLECSVAAFGGAGHHRRYVHVVYDVTERERLAQERGRLIDSLDKRVTELRSLYAISELLEAGGPPLAERLAQAVRVLPRAFRYPQHVRAWLAGETGLIGEPGTQASAPALRCELQVNGRRFGVLTLRYDNVPEIAALGDSAFLPEERQLFTTVGQRLSAVVEREENAVKVRRLTYLYETLSAVNRSIAHCAGKDALIDGIFDALTQHGPYSLLVIAAAPEGAAACRVTHRHGSDAAIEQDVDALLAEIAVPDGEGQQALRAGRVVWRSFCAYSPPAGAGADRIPEVARIEGALLPLLSDGTLLGVIALYVRGLDAFQPAERELLEEMTADLRFAFDGFTAIERSRVAQHKADVSESRFRDVFEFSPLPKMIESVAERRIQTVNRSFQQWLGYTLSDLPTEDAWLSRLQPAVGTGVDVRSEWRRALRAARDSESPAQTAEMVLRTRDGSERVARASLTVVDGDAIVTWTDLTDIRQAERALKASESHFRNMIEQTVAGIYVQREDYFIYVNPSYCQLLGWSREELLGLPFWEFVADDPGHVRDVRSALDRLSAGEGNVRLEVRMRCKSGEIRELGLHATTVRWDSAPAMIVIASDITERKQAQEKIADYVHQLEASMRGTLRVVSNMIDRRDPYTAGHQRRVGLIAGAIAREMGYPAERSEALELIGLVHDVGKISVPAEILSKPGRLSEVEMELVRDHAQAGYEILKDVPFSFPVAEIIYQHHERLDGSGYPRGLKDGQILPEARILAVADVLESIVSHRPYRAARGIATALEELERGRGSRYDEAVVDATLRLMRQRGYKLPQ